jgi:hypothetical protein
MKKVLIIILVLFFACKKDETIKPKKMSEQIINVGNSYDDPDADKGRDALSKCKNNFSELYTNPIVVVPIGAWNMDATSSKDVNYIPPSGYKVIGCEGMIEDDSGVLTLPIDYAYPQALPDGCIYRNGNKFTLIRKGSGTFDDSSYSGSSSNRGYVIVTLLKL